MCLFAHRGDGHHYSGLRQLGGNTLLAMAGTGYGLIGILVIILLVLLIVYFVRRT